MARNLRLARASRSK